MPTRDILQVLLPTPAPAPIDTLASVAGVGKVSHADAPSAGPCRKPRLDSASLAQNGICSLFALASPFPAKVTSMIVV